MKKRSADVGASAMTFGAVVIVVAGLLAGLYLVSPPLGGDTTTQTSSTTTGSGIQGVVTGYVTAGPSQPVCTPDQSCNENMSGYSLVFTPQCSGPSSDCQTRTAVLSPSGHYSILLPAGSYSVTGLVPSCPWLGCSSAFPKTITVEGGMQLVFNVDIDTGIR